MNPTRDSGRFCGRFRSGLTATFTTSRFLQSSALDAPGPDAPVRKAGPPGIRPRPMGYTRNTSDYGISGGGFGGSSEQQGESIENLLRRFKRKVQTEDIIKDVKRHSFYLKPGEKKRVKQALAQKRARKKSRTSTDERR